MTVEHDTVRLKEQAHSLVLMLETQHLKQPHVAIFKENLYKALATHISSKPCLINFSNIHYMDSFSLAVILSIFKFCRETDRPLALTHLNEQVQKLIQLTRLQTILPVFSTDEEAVTALA